MILQSLCKLYDRLAADPSYEVAPPGYSLQKISYKVVIREDGTLFDVQDARVPAEPRPRSRQIIVPGGGKPTGDVTDESVHKKVLPLRNDLAFLVGATVKEELDESTGRKHRVLVPSPREFEAFKKYHLDAKDEIGDDSAFIAVCRFLATWDPQEAVKHLEWADLADGQGVFQILGETGWVHDRSGVRAWWDRKCQEDVSDVTGECLVSGKVGSLARLHEPKIKGVAGPKAEALLISFNESAFQSYGKHQSFNAPVSEHAAHRYATALNALLDGPRKDKHKLSVGDTTVVFWTERPTATEDIFAVFASEGSTALESEGAQDESVRKRVELFLRALREGRQAYADLDEDIERTPYFMLGLAPNAGRLAVRFFHNGTLGDLLDHLRAHYADIGLEGQPARGNAPADPEFPPTWLLLDQTCPRRNGKPDRDKIAPILGGPLLRAIVTGARYPSALFSAVVRRVQADSVVNYLRASIIKGYLVRNLGKEISMSLDVERQDPAYRMGRLFAALEKTQRDALGENLNRTIRDSFYSAASATPGVVFPRLLRTYQHHLGKLDGGLKVNREKLVQEIHASLESYPAHLGLAEQGLFAIGYYHQTRDFYTSKAPKP